MNRTNEKQNYIGFDYSSLTDNDRKWKKYAVEVGDTNDPYKNCDYD